MLGYKLNLSKFGLIINYQIVGYEKVRVIKLFDVYIGFIMVFILLSIFVV